MKHEDGFEAFAMRINPAKAYELKDAPVRPYPRFAELKDFEPGTRFKATIPTALRTWWFVGILAVIALWVIFIPLGFSWGIDLGGYDNRGRFTQPSVSYGPVMIMAIVLVALSWAILRAVFPRIVIEADKDEILVGKYRYGWNNAAGMRVGYSIGGVERSNEQWKFCGLRMAYGQWGHDLPYMASGYYSVAYVAWINQLLETIKHDMESVNDAAAGIKQQMY